MKIITLILSLFIAFSSSAQAQTVNAEDIKRIEKYLNDITTLTAPFTQEDNEGSKAKGTFYLERPGKLRWDYAPPTPILIVARGSRVVYYDKELEEVSNVGIDDTLAGFLTREKISFGDKGIKIIDFVKKNDEISATIAQNQKEDQGTLKMVFSNTNIQLLRLEVLDAIGKNTIVRFSDLVYNTPINKELFAFPKANNKLR